MEGSLTNIKEGEFIFYFKVLAVLPAQLWERPPVQHFVQTEKHLNIIQFFEASCER